MERYHDRAHSLYGAIGRRNGFKSHTSAGPTPATGTRDDTLFYRRARTTVYGAIGRRIRLKNGTSAGSIPAMPTQSGSFPDIIRRLI